MGDLYNRLVLPPPKCPISEFFANVQRLNSSAGKNLFHDVFPRYRKIADQIEECGYQGIAELIRFCFDETSEYFTRGITEETNWQTVKAQIGSNIDASTRGLAYAFTELSKPAVIANIAKLYQTLVPKGEETLENRELIGNQIEKSIESLEREDTRPIRKALSAFSCQTYQDENLTLTINYLNKVFNTDLKTIKKGEETNTLIRHLKKLSKAIKTRDELVIYDSLDRIANLAYSLRDR